MSDARYLCGLAGSAVLGVLPQDDAAAFLGDGGDRARFEKPGWFSPNRRQLMRLAQLGQASGGSHVFSAIGGTRSRPGVPMIVAHRCVPASSRPTGTTGR